MNKTLSLLLVFQNKKMLFAPLYIFIESVLLIQYTPHARNTILLIYTAFLITEYGFKTPDIRPTLDLRMLLKTVDIK